MYNGNILEKLCMDQMKRIFNPIPVEAFQRYENELNIIKEGQAEKIYIFLACIFHSCSTTCTSILSQSHGR